MPGIVLELIAAPLFSAGVAFPFICPVSLFPNPLAPTIFGLIWVLGGRLALRPKYRAPGALLHLITLIVFLETALVWLIKGSHAPDGPEPGVPIETTWMTEHEARTQVSQTIVPAAAVGAAIVIITELILAALGKNRKQPTTKSSGGDQ